MVTNYSIGGSWLAPSFRTIAAGDCNTSTLCQLENTFNCDATVGYFADSISTAAKAQFVNNVGDAGAITTWLGTMVPKDWQYDADNKQFTWEQLDSSIQDSHLMLWYYEVWQNDTFAMTQDEIDNYLSVLNYSQSEAYSCDDKKICNELEIRGDPDVSGRGMLMAYAILAILTTLYFLILTADQFLDRFRLSHGEDRRRTNWTRVVMAMKDTVDEFLSAALIFAVAMLGATVARNFVYSNRKEELRTDDVWSYALLGSALTSVFSIFPCMVLQSVTGIISSHNQRLFLWCLVVALATAVGFMSHNTLTDLFRVTDAYQQIAQNQFKLETPSDVSYNQSVGVYDETAQQAGYYYRAMIWEKYCFPTSDTHNLKSLVAAGFWLQTLCYLFCLLSTLVVLLPAISPIRPSSSPEEYVKNRYGTLASHFTQIMKYLRLVMGLVYLGMTWLFFAKFISYRREVKNIASGTDQDSDWSFGQILALAQWIPVVISVLSSWKKSTPHPVSEGKVLLHDYEAVDHSDRRGSETSYKSPARHTTV